VTEADITAAATNRWTSPTMPIDKITIDHPTYNSRCLAKLIFGSVTDDFAIIIINRVKETYKMTVHLYFGPYVILYTEIILHLQKLSKQKSEVSP
jgi:hypothetical protein